MQKLEILRHNAATLAKLPRAAQAADRKQFALLEKQARIWNDINEVLKVTRGDAREAILDVMGEILNAVDVGIAKRNVEFRAACVAAGIWKDTSKKSAPKAKRRAPKSKHTAQVLKLRQAFRALPKAA